jgi:putative endonuclease
MIRGLIWRAAELIRRIASGAADDSAGGRTGLGQRGERSAERYLRRRGYRILGRNFRAAGAEIDLIAADGATLVFIEVKARRSLTAGTPLEAVDARKQNRIRRAAQIYAARSGAHERPIRFDVVAIRWDGRDKQIELVRDAF